MEKEEEEGKEEREGHSSGCGGGGYGTRSLLFSLCVVVLAAWNYRYEFLGGVCCVMGVIHEWLEYTWLVRDVRIR